MNPPIESQFTEILIERNVYARTLEKLTAYLWGKRGAIACEAMEIINQGRRELNDVLPEHYQEELR